LDDIAITPELSQSKKHLLNEQRVIYVRVRVKGPRIYNTLVPICQGRDIIDPPSPV
jgi:hypothetical protein